MWEVDGCYIFKFISCEFCRNFQTYYSQADKIKQLKTSMSFNKSYIFWSRKIIHLNIRANYSSPLTLSLIWQFYNQVSHSVSLVHGYPPIYEKNLCLKLIFRPFQLFHQWLSAFFWPFTENKCVVVTCNYDCVKQWNSIDAISWSWYIWNKIPAFATLNKNFSGDNSNASSNQKNPLHIFIVVVTTTMIPPPITCILVSEKTLNIKL